MRRPPSGPHQRLRQAWIQQQQANLSGDPLQMQDAAFRLQQAQAAVDRAQRRLNPPPPPGLGQRLQSAALSSRIGFSGQGIQIAPLVGRLGSVLGGGVAGGLAGLGIGAATSALRLFTERVREASVTLGGISAAGSVTGGTGQQAALLRAFGIDPNQQGNFAANLRQRVAMDPWAMSAAGRLGMGSVAPREADPGFNEGRFAAEIVRRLAAQPNPTTRRGLAVQLGIEDRLPQIEAAARNPGLLRAMERNAATMGDPSRIQDVNRLNDELARLRAELETIKTRGSTTMIRDWSIAARTAAGNAERGQEGWSFFLDSLYRLIASRGGAQRDGNAALQQNTQQLAQLNQNLLRLAPGIYGGGPGAQSILPKGWRQEATQKLLADETLRLGYFNL